MKMEFTNSTIIRLICFLSNRVSLILEFNFTNVIFPLSSDVKIKCKGLLLSLNSLTFQTSIHIDMNNKKVFQDY